MMEQWPPGWKNIKHYIMAMHYNMALYNWTFFWQHKRMQHSTELLSEGLLPVKCLKFCNVLALTIWIAFSILNKYFMLVTIKGNLVWHPLKNHCQPLLNLGQQFPILPKQTSMQYVPGIFICTWKLKLW